MDLLGHYLQDRQQKIRKTTDGIRSEIYEQLEKKFPMNGSDR